HILEGIVVLHERIHTLWSTKLDIAIFKVDFGKAYNKFKWPFLQQYMQMKGFPTKWRQWIDSFV
uniref:Reverse transcriptase domain-containing protein n=3 Tax=Aegilops tauschii subsp. strangulata TaxID=200361 RepID=A0A453JKM9_AEGTS